MLTYGAPAPQMTYPGTTGGYGGQPAYGQPGQPGYNAPGFM